MIKKHNLRGFGVSNKKGIAQGFNMPPASRYLVFYSLAGLRPISITIFPLSYLSGKLVKSQLFTYNFSSVLISPMPGGKVFSELLCERSNRLMAVSLHMLNKWYHSMCRLQKWQSHLTTIDKNDFLWTVTDNKVILKTSS